MTISLRLQSPLLKETTTIRTLLTFVLMAATQDYPSTQSLAAYLDENYGKDSFKDSRIIINKYLRRSI